MATAKEQIDEILKLGIPEQIGALSVKDDTKADKKKWLDQYNGKHEILKREDKTIEVERTDKNGNPIYVQDNNGNDTDQIQTKSETVGVNRLVITFQKKIVRIAKYFAIGGGVLLSPKIFDEAAKQIIGIFKTANEKAIEFYNLISRFMEDVNISKLDNDILEIQMKETEVAELWTLIPKDMTIDGEYGITVKLLHTGNGNNIYPIYDPITGQLIVFSRQYTTKNIDGETIQHFDVYTTEKFYFYINDKDKGWTEERQEPNLYKIVPVVYHSQDEPEWIDVQTSIERLELAMSKFSDTNDYHAAPSVVTKGNISAAPKKDQVSKHYQVEPSFDKEDNPVWPTDPVSIISWQNGPEAIEAELKNLNNIINSMTSTPDISFQNLQSIGPISGVALKLMFLDAIMKASEHREEVEDGIKRRLSILKAIIGNVANVASKSLINQLIVEISFGEVLPSDVKELVDTLSIAVGGENTMSQETAVENNPLVENPIIEMARIENENREKLAAERELAGTFTTEETGEENENTE